MPASSASADERPLVELASAALSTPTSTSAPAATTAFPPPAAPGFSRLVRCNAPSSFPADGGGGAQQAYPGNAISTTKYTPASFVPKSLFEQFRRAANFFFLVVACVSFSPLAPYRAVSVLLPLVVVIGAAMAKEAVEDWRRKQQDIEVNNRKVEVYGGVQSFHVTEWKKLRVGDIVKVKKDEFFPADLLLLSSSYEDGICYVETMNLDGETNLKRKQSLDVTVGLKDEHFLHSFKAFIQLPISLYISIEIVKVLQSTFINQDRDMYCEESDKPARARTSNLNEELGQVHTILSDKTGTLTCNSMEFVKCSIAGVAYGNSPTEVEMSYGGIDEHSSCNRQKDAAKSVKGFNFTDDRLMNGKWTMECSQGAIEMFFHVLSVCHTTIPVSDRNFVGMSYEAESPDEAALVTAAREFGFEFYHRTQTTISVHEHDAISGRKVDRTYKILNILEFSSARKRMSVIVRTEEGQIFLFCKGADSVILERLSKDNEKACLERTKSHINEYSEAGLRTLALAYRELTEEEYSAWNNEYSAAKNSVPECIHKLAQAGIKIWILTGDKLETAVNIGLASFVVTYECTGEGNRMVPYDEIDRKLQDARRKISSKDNSTPFALIIDGNALTYALTGRLKNSFLDLAVDCASVLCCRISPKQKALVTRLVKFRTRKTTLAIGDGANDVGMLQEADIGVGISGAEGMQAVMASDFAIAQFRFLEQLLLVHGHWCYRRIAAMICYIFFKNLTFGLTLFWFEAHAMFSAQPAYNDWFMSFYNVAFTSLPVIALGVFDKDVSSRVCLKVPSLHLDGVNNTLFSWSRILSWMLNGMCCSIIIYFGAINAVLIQAVRLDGRVAGFDILGVTMYTCVVWTVNCQLALYISYFTWIQHFVIWGSILIWYMFLVIYGMFPAQISTTAYHVFLEACAPSPIYWLSTLIIVVTALLPFFLYKIVQSVFYPRYHEQVQRADSRKC
ncbi:hypothetical protein PR202_ga20799 [Eleusine coracana subsp. coracana]|uniref:Phospholipid-transporting ATPase n=1 Tax=Eleusine coracana subsp. coracana TaxID=191504 RepID=A0AAV5CY23_ELECO|nr:hypothetical protein PR202_ga20799 [Eleusine coracana subsp. coracana]